MDRWRDRPQPNPQRPPYYQTRSISIGPPSQDPRYKPRETLSPEDALLNRQSNTAHHNAHSPRSQPPSSRPDVTTSRNNSSQTQWIPHGQSKYMLESIYHRVMTENLSLIQDMESQHQQPPPHPSQPTLTPPPPTRPQIPLIAYAGTRSASASNYEKSLPPVSRYASAPADLPLRRREPNPAKHHLQPAKVQPRVDWRRLPPPVLECIISGLGTIHLRSRSPTCHTCLMRDLSSISLTCRSYSTTAQRLLYSNIHFTGPDSASLRRKFKVAHGARLILFRRTLRSNQRLARLVRNLHVPDPIIPLYQSNGHPNPEYDAYLCLLASVVMECPDLEVFSGFHAFYNHTFDRLTHALSTRTKLKEHVWIIAENDEVAERSQRMLAPGLLDPEQVFQLMTYHSRWNNLETLMLCSPAALGVIEHGLFLEILHRLPSLKNLCVSGFDADDFSDTTLLSLPSQISRLRLEEVQGVTDFGISRWAASPASVNITHFSLINQNLHSLVTIAKIFSGLDRLQHFTISQSDHAPGLPLDMVVFQPFFSSRTVETIHWDIGDDTFSSPTSATTAEAQALEDMATADIEVLKKTKQNLPVSPNTHLALSILNHGFPTLKSLCAPRDTNPAGVLQSVCQPARDADVLLSRDRYRYMCITRKVAFADSLGNGQGRLVELDSVSDAQNDLAESNWLRKSNDLQAARFRAQMLIDKAVRESREGWRVVVSEHADGPARVIPEHDEVSTGLEGREDSTAAVPVAVEDDADLTTITATPTSRVARERRVTSDTNTETEAHAEYGHAHDVGNASSNSSLESELSLFRHDREDGLTRQTTTSTQSTDITEPEVTELLTEAGHDEKAKIKLRSRFDPDHSMEPGEEEEELTSVDVRRSWGRSDWDKEATNEATTVRQEDVEVMPTRYKSLNGVPTKTEVKGDLAASASAIAPPASIANIRPYPSISRSQSEPQEVQVVPERRIKRKDIQHPQPRRAMQVPHTSSTSESKSHLRPHPAHNPPALPPPTTHRASVPVTSHTSHKSHTSNTSPSTTHESTRYSQPTRQTSHPSPPPRASHSLSPTHPNLRHPPNTIRIPSPIPPSHSQPYILPLPSPTKITQFSLPTFVGRISIHISSSGEVLFPAKPPVLRLVGRRAGGGNGNGSDASWANQYQNPNVAGGNTSSSSSSDADPSDNNGGVATWGGLLRIGERRRKAEAATHAFDNNGKKSRNGGGDTMSKFRSNSTKTRPGVEDWRGDSEDGNGNGGEDGDGDGERIMTKGCTGLWNERERVGGYDMGRRDDKGKKASEEAGVRGDRWRHTPRELETVVRVGDFFG